MSPLKLITRAHATARAQPELAVSRSMRGIGPSAFRNEAMHVYLPFFDFASLNPVAIVLLTSKEHPQRYANPGPTPEAHWLASIILTKSLRSLRASAGTAKSEMHPSQRSPCPNFAPCLSHTSRKYIFLPPKFVRYQFGCHSENQPFLSSVYAILRHTTTTRHKGWAPFAGPLGGIGERGI